MQKLIIAHRGASVLSHENTLAAFQKAIDLGADMIELDVRRTADGVLCVFHNPDLAGLKLSGIKFADLNKVAQTQGFKVPTLEEACKLIVGKIKLVAELKEAGYEKEVGEIIYKILPHRDVWLSSFNASAVLAAKKFYPDSQIALIVGTNWRDWGKIIKLIVSKKFADQFAVYNFSWNLWDYGIVRLFKTKSKMLLPWTVDEPNNIKEYLLEPRLAGIFTNVPDVALKIRSEL